MTQNPLDHGSLIHCADTSAHLKPGSFMPESVPGSSCEDHKLGVVTTIESKFDHWFQCENPLHRDNICL